MSAIILMASKLGWRVPLLIGCLACMSCSGLKTDQRTSRAQAEERWSNVRARIKHQIAVEDFNRGELEGAQKQLDDALSLDPTLPDAYVLQSRILLERGEIAAAQEALQTAIMHGANNADTDYLAGVIAERYGRSDDALTAYRRAADRDPRNAHYVAAVAETLVALNRPAEALELIERCRTDFENNATLRAIAGQIHMLMGRYEQAANVFREASRISPDDMTLRAQLGLALALAEKNTEAVAVLAPVVSQSKNAPGYLLVALGRAYLGLGRYEDAKATLRTATEASPASLAAWSWLARASLTGGDLVTAREAAEHAAGLSDTSPEAQILLGYVCLRQGDPGAAIPALEAALKRQPGDALAQRLLTQARLAHSAQATHKGPFQSSGATQGTIRPSAFQGAHSP